MPLSLLGVFDRLAHWAHVSRPPIVDDAIRAADVARGLGHPLRASYSGDVRRAVEMMHLTHVPAHLLQNVNRIVDVGANVGDWSVAAARLFPSAEIRAYEPVPETYSTLEARLSRAPLAKAYQLAITDEPGAVEIHTYERHEMASLLKLERQAAKAHGMNAEPSATITVPASTLDAELEHTGPVGILKLDVQGHETAVIRGGVRTLASTDVLVMEVTFTEYYEGDADFWSLHQLITDRTPLVLWDLAKIRRSANGRAMWTDAIYVHPRACGL